MKLQPLYDLQQEINRLFIAGSKFAKGDPRLQKHIPILNKLGEKAPVFKKLATDIEELLNTDTQQSAEKLMAISTLLYSVLYTQGDMTELDVEAKEQVPYIDIKNVNTTYSYLQLKPVIQALTSSNSGRIETLKDAFERNVFDDSRTYGYLNGALADKYSELCYYVENTIITSIGKPMLPFLLQSFAYEDKTEHARRFRLICRFEPDMIPEMTEKIMAGSLPNLQAAAIEVLSNDTANEELIIKLADDKNKIVREAAYNGLAKMNTQKSLEKLKDAYLTNKNKTNLPFIVNALASTKLPFFFQEVFNKVVSSFNEFITLDKTTDDKVLVEKLDNFRTELEILNNKDDEKVLPFLSSVLQNQEYQKLISAKKSLLENLSYSVSHVIISILNGYDKKNGLVFYEENIGKIPEVNWKTPLWNTYFYLSVECGYPKEKVFDIFSDVFKRKIIGMSNLYNAFTNDSNYYHYSDRKIEVYTDKIDPRWLPVFYAQFDGKVKWNYEKDQALKLLNVCEPNKEKLDKLLVELANKVQPAEEIEIFKLLVERNVSNCFEIIFSVMAKFPKNTYYYALNRLKNIGVWSKFPKEYAEKYRKLYEQNKLEIYSDIADEINGF